MRDGWTETTLGELCEIYQPETISKAQMDPAAPYLVYGANGPVGRYSKFNHEESEVVVTCRGATCGVVNVTPPNCWITGNAMVVKPRDNRSTKGFLFWALQTSVDIQATISGSAQPQITRTGLAPSKIRVPPVEEQKRIVDVVSSVDAYIDALQQQADTARTARNAVLHELLSAGGDDWTETTLGDVAEVLDRMRKPVSGAEREKRQGQVPYYGATGQAGWIDAPIFDEELVLLGEDAIDFLNPLVHKAYLISGPSWVNNHAHVLRARRERVLAYFLMEALNAVDYSRFVAFGTRSKLTQSAMMDITINLPPLAEQKRIVEMVSSMDEVIQSTEQAVVDAKNLRSGLLSDLLSGEHEIPASYDVFVGAA